MADLAGNGDAGRDRLWRGAPWIFAALLLLLPLVAMQFTDEVEWGKTDFLLMGAMLFGVCGLYELAAKMTGSVAYRAAVVVAVGTAFILIWINLAVGIVGSEENPANLMYGGVLAVAILGALIARFRPDGMARALAATAFAQVSVGIIVLLAGLGSNDPKGPEAVVVLTCFFAALWLGSAWLFRKAARELPSAGSATRV